MSKNKRSQLGHLVRSGYQQYTAIVSRFGSCTVDHGKRYHLTICLRDICGSDGTYVDHQWFICRDKWRSLQRSSLVEFEARVRKHSQGYQLANCRNITKVKK